MARVQHTFFSAFVVVIVISCGETGNLRSGWPALETTTGWPAVETTTGWSIEETTTETPGWPGKETGWPSQGWIQTTPETTTGWPSVEETTGWSQPTAPTTVPPGWVQHQPHSGWDAAPPPPPGWGHYPQPTGWNSEVDIEMEGQAVVTGQGAAGASHGSTTTVIGDPDNHAVLDVDTGSYATIDQLAEVTQVSAADESEGSTVQVVGGHNIVDSGEYYEGHLSGNDISVQNQGSSFVAGQGTIGLSGSTENNVAKRHTA